jgi:hypothetical protein
MKEVGVRIFHKQELHEHEFTVLLTTTMDNLEQSTDDHVEKEMWSAQPVSLKLVQRGKDKE